ncbi:MICOS complex subunit MIC10 [Raphanus sativus]|uniref:MICOS complex subunit MIC10 n=1 Tax=Raphanus sativus TaxID=3726 RepID=A0A6J0JHV6_RAPSA|nr:MICOS complex subunit MIC10 [Raphanus sativus]
MEKKKKSNDVDTKWDACLDLTARRVVYSSLGGAFAGLLFFRSPVTRWASIAFGAGIGIGSAYADCSRLFGSSSSATLLPPPKSSSSSSSGCRRVREAWGINPNIDDGFLIQELL